MKTPRIKVASLLFLFILSGVAVWRTRSVLAQMPDRTQTPNVANFGIAKSLQQQIGAGRGNWTTSDSSSFIIARDPFRAIRRGRQLFQRKFLRSQGLGPLTDDGVGDINTNLALGAGISDSCAGCHGRPRGAAGSGGDVVTRPDSRDAPHLFGLGLKEMLADEITTDLRSIRAQAIAQARTSNRPVVRPLKSKGIDYGSILAQPNGAVDTSQVRGVNPDLRIRPFFAHGGKISIREFLVGAFNDEMGLQSVDPEMMQAHNGTRVTTPSGMVLDGTQDQIEAPPTDVETADPDHDGVANEMPTSLVDFMEFYLLNYFKPAIYQQSDETEQGRKLFARSGCTQCHIPDLLINRDRRVADLETAYDPERGIFNNLFGTAYPLFNATDDHSGFPTLKQPRLQPFLVSNIFTDLKRHNLGPSFYERNFDGTLRSEFLTTPLWGVGSSAPYGHDGRSINLIEVILRHGGEAQSVRDAFANLTPRQQARVIEFLNSLVLFPPDDTASTLDPGNRDAFNFPQFGHGSIKLTALFNNPNDPE
ncbi:MAG TPA: di-heme oxidoredictase family protein [Pyrinomonadaceae bacterium]|nr:di-heme oxidoredictase family protein [Pyrinomonadaceae bacterium]